MDEEIATVDCLPLRSIVAARPPRIKILEWLSPLTFHHKHEEVFSQLQPGTGDWLLNDEIFQEWLGSRSRVLLCHGMPGVGKTTLASLVVDECLRKQNDSKGTIGLVYVYCEYNHEQSQTITDLIGAILRQLENLVTINPDLEALYAQHENGPHPPPPLSLPTMMERIKSCLAKFTTVYLILDALDECSVRDELLNDYIAELLASDDDRILRIFATSRPLPEVRNFFAIYGDPQLNVSARDEDIKLYLEGRLQHYERLQKPLSMVLTHSVEVRTMLLERICERSCGMFLVARLHIESLALVPDKNTLLMYLDKLPKGLDAVYKMTIDRIKCDQSKCSWLMAQKAFMWVTYSMVPLRISQLLEAVASEPSGTSFDSSKMTDQETLLSACGGLLQVTPRDSDPHRSQKVEFIHMSAKEYFIKDLSILLPGSEAGNQGMDTLEKEIHCQIALICLNYLITDKVRQRKEYAIRDCVVNDSSPGLDYYSICYWGLHAMKANQAKIIPVLHSLFAEDLADTNYDSSNAITFHFDSTGLPKEFGAASRHALELCYAHGFAIGIAVVFGLKTVVWDFLESVDDINTKLRDLPKFRLLVLYAIRTGDLALLDRFIECGFDFNSVPVREKGSIPENSPFFIAVAEGSCAVVERLSKNVGKLDRESALTFAISSGRDDVAEILLKDSRVNINPNGTGEPSHINISYNVWEPGVNYPLITAVLACRPHIVQLLVARPDLDPNTATWPDGNTALLVALTHKEYQSNSDRENHQKLQTLMVSILLTRQDLDLNKPDSCGMTPLHAAIDVGNADVVETLLTYRTVNPNRATNTGETPLRTALLRLDIACDKEIEHSVIGYLRIVKCLLAREDLDVNLTIHEDGIPPLHLALAEAINIQTASGIHSTHVETEDTVLVPINPPSDPEINSSPTHVYLHHTEDTEDTVIDTKNTSATANNVETLLSRFLARTDLDVNKSNKAGQTALMLALSRGQELNVELLLGRPDIDINIADNNGKTALDYAKDNGNVGIIALLNQKATEA